MSAYICNPSHHGILAAYAAINRCVIGEYSNNEPVLAAQAVAKELARENIRSVAYRYPSDKDGDRPGPSLKDAAIIEAAALYAAHFVVNQGAVKALRAVDVLSLCNGLDYQCCETDDYGASLTRRQIDWIKNDVIRTLPGYSNAPHEYQGVVPHIENLIWGEVAA